VIPVGAHCLPLLLAGHSAADARDNQVSGERFVVAALSSIGRRKTPPGSSLVLKSSTIAVMSASARSNDDSSCRHEKRRVSSLYRPAAAHSHGTSPSKY
jgi:hypothetical protein